MPFPGSAETEKPDTFLNASSPPTLAYPSFSDFIIQCPSFNASIHDRPDLFDKIVCPYNVDGFALLLDKHDLTMLYPELITNLRRGFPLGCMPELHTTHVIPNHPTALEHPSAVDDYLKVEIAAGRTSGPFSHEMVEHILRGPFQSSPLIVAIQPQALGELDKLRICWHLSKSTKIVASVNSFISKHDFPTCFDTVIRVANMVSTHTLQITLPTLHLVTFFLPETYALSTSFLLKTYTSCMPFYRRLMLRALPSCQRLMLRAHPSAGDLCSQALPSC